MRLGTLETTIISRRSLQAVEREWISGMSTKPSVIEQDLSKKLSYVGLIFDGENQN